MARVRIDPKGLNKALSGPKMRDELQGIVNRIASDAEQSAPFDTGEYRDGIHAEVIDGWVRPRGKVYAEADHSMAVESRTGNLAKALGRAGG